jgi:hypothetical protein
MKKKKTLELNLNKRKVSQLKGTDKERIRGGYITQWDGAFSCQQTAGSWWCSGAYSNC